MPFRKDEGVWWALCATRLELLAEGDLLRTQAFLPVHGGPARCRMTAAKEFLINAFVAGAAIASGEMSADSEPVVINLLLAGAGLVTVQAINALLRMSGHLIFVDD